MYEYSSPESSPQKNKTKMFSFIPFKMFKIEAIGNQRRGIYCPSPRSGHRIVVANGNVYSFGGYNPLTIDLAVEHILFKELWIYNCVSRTWRLLETSGNAPDELASHCAAYLDNHLLIFGGTAYPFGAKTSNDLHICNLRSLQWSKLETSGSAPLKQYGQAMALHGNTLYVIGGTTGYAYSNEVHSFNLATKEWRQLFKSSGLTHSQEPEPRYRHEIAIEDNKIYVFGGGTASESFDLNELPVFNLANHTWDKVKTSGCYVASRRCHSLVKVGSDIYIFGGLNGLHVFDDFYKIDLKTLKWERFVSLPKSLYFHAASVSDSGQMFIFGGVGGIENERTNEMYSMWLGIPSLATICWQAINHYVPHISSLKKKDLFEVGVPIRYINEIEFVSSTNSNAISNTTTVSQVEAIEDGWEML